MNYFNLFLLCTFTNENSLTFVKTSVIKPAHIFEQIEASDNETKRKQYIYWCRTYNVDNASLTMEMLHGNVAARPMYRVELPNE